MRGFLYEMINFLPNGFSSFTKVGIFILEIALEIGFFNFTMSHKSILRRKIRLISEVMKGGSLDVRVNERRR